MEPVSPAQPGTLFSPFAPAAVGLTMFVLMAQIRMEDPWSDGALLALAAAPALLLLALGFAAGRGDDSPRAAVTIFLVAGLALAGLAIVRLADVLAGDDATAAGGTLTWMLLAFAALAWFSASRTGSVASVLIGALASVALLLEAVNWIFDTENLDTYRVLLALAFAVLFIAGLVMDGRAGVVLVAAAGITVLATAFVNGVALFFVPLFGGAGVAWGWELVTLVEGVALLAYAAVWLEPGPAYLAFFALGIFVMTAVVSGGVEVIDGSSSESSDSLSGWPLALAIGTVVATLWGLRASRRAA